MNKFQLRNAIEKRKNSYTDEDLFGSPYFTDILKNVVEATCHRLGRIPTIDTEYSPESNLTAYTNGSHIHQNTMGPLVRTMPDSWLKYLINIGKVTHECCHVLFTDFKNQNLMKEAWHQKEFGFWPEQPKGGKELADKLNKNPTLRKVYMNEILNMCNILEDVYIENRGFNEFGGLATAGLILTSKELYNQSDCLEEVFTKYLQGSITAVSVANYLSLIKERGYEPKANGTLNGQKEFEEAKNKIYSVLHKLEDHYKKLAIEQNGRNRCKLFNEIVVILSELLPENDEELEENFQNSMAQSDSSGEGDSNQNQEADQSSESQSQSGQSSSKSQIAEEMNETSNNILSDNGMSEEATGNTTAITSEAIDEQGTQAKKQMADGLANNQSSINTQLQDAIKKCAEQEVIEEDEQQHQKDLQKESKKILDNNSRGKSQMFTGYKIYRSNTFDKEFYQIIYSKVEATSKSLVRKLSSILKERKIEGYDSGYLMGQRFNATDVYRGDGMYFSREIVPDGQPDVVFGVLVDESGSMSGDKASLARQQAILLEDVLRKLNIPLLLCGHDESWGDVNIYSYVDFDTNDNNDRYRLSNIDGHGCNVDGAAITYLGEKLLKRPEKIKVMIVISDGRPTGSSFYSADEDEDTAMAIKKYRKKDIKVFGAIIDQFKNVNKLYGDNYAFDCTSGDSLEKELIKLVKKYVLIK